MLTNSEQFKNVEDGLRAMGAIGKFESENGPILGRMMVTTTDIPESIPVKREDRENLVAFEASFDFCNVALGVVTDPVKKTLESSVWGRYQTPGAERPSEEWVRFFITTLFEHIGSDGSFGISSRFKLGANRVSQSKPCWSKNSSRPSALVPPTS